MENEPLPPPPETAPAPVAAADFPPVTPDFRTPRLQALEAHWLARQGQVTELVTAALARSCELRPGSEVRRQEERGRRAVRRPDGTTWQQTLDETVQWIQERGHWELALPPAVVGKLRGLEHAPQIAVAKPAYDADDVQEEERVAQKLTHVARVLQAQLDREDADALFGEPSIRYLKGLAMRYRNMPVQGKKGVNDATGVRHSFYYTFDPLPSAKSARPGQAVEPGHSAEEWTGRLAAALAAHNHELAWACQTVLRGRPSRISNFYIEPLYTLKRADGSKRRVFLLHTANRLVPEGPLELEGKGYSTPSHLREWLNEFASGVWHAGEKELQLVIEDCALVFDQKEVEEVAVIGWHAGARAWFTHGAAIDCRGEVRRPSKAGVFALPVERANGEGFTWKRYRMAEKDKDGFHFALRQLNWRPELVLADRELSGWERDHGWERIGPADLRGFFACFADRMHDVAGGWPGYMLVGWALAYGAAPEVFAQHAAFPGYWIHGEARQGKSSLARWAMKMWGYSANPPGVSLESSTGAGGETVMQQYHNLPAWFEEAQNSMKETLMVVLKAGFNRVPPQKRVTNLREVLTSPLVVGITTCGDAQIRSRYPHHLASEKLRLPRVGDLRADGTAWSATEARARQNENYDWLQERQERFVLFGRAVLERRAEFVERFQRELNGWLRGADTGRLDERAKLVHGVCYAGFAAMCGLLEVRHLQVRQTVPREPVNAHRLTTAPLRPVMAEFRAAMIEEAKASAQDVNEAAELDKYFRAIVTGFQMGAFGETVAEQAKFFKVLPGGRMMCAPEIELPDVSPEQQAAGLLSQHGRWDTVHLAINSSLVGTALRQFLRMSNETLPMREDDVWRQLSVKPCWVPPGPQMRFGETRSRDYMVLNLDLLPDWGYRPHLTESPVMQDWLRGLDVRLMGEELRAPSTPANDPRRGPLYRIVEALKKNQTP